MYNCPRCNSTTISGFRKWTSSTRTPAECSQCGALCVVPIVNSSGIPAASAVLLAAAGFAAVALQSGIVFALGAACTFAFYLWRWHLAPLIGLSIEQRDSARAIARSVSLLGLLVGIFSR
jgi:hypothetical protein